MRGQIYGFIDRFLFENIKVSTTYSFLLSYGSYIVNMKDKQ